MLLGPKSPSVQYSKFYFCVHLLTRLLIFKFLNRHWSSVSVNWHGGTFENGNGDYDIENNVSFLQFYVNAKRYFFF